ncbi:hypothetical protein [Amycolatopsis sp. cmx-11-32]|uniref:hypothetical protein n=1 Tax=Amycolatopsis sp. cmx-11-32 TaxID=2785796 RepID=UPI0039E6FE8C
MRVVEDVMVMDSDRPLRSVGRDEHLLLAPPHPPTVPMKPPRPRPPLAVVHFPQEYRDQPFAPPRGLYENDQARVEWQTMNNRQPFYHRNCDVDEISYQIAGERTLMTELGVIEHRPGEFSRIPRGVAHDNYGRGESHLLFYLPAPAEELGGHTGESRAVTPPFPGWAAAPINEAVTQCMGAHGHDIAVFPVDERELLDRVHEETDRIPVLCGPDSGHAWLYATEKFRLGTEHLAAHQPRRYRRMLDADEIQYQISGRRVLLTQRGIVELGPGDAVRIPLGVAHAGHGEQDGVFIRLLSHRELPQVADTARTAEPYSPQLLAEIVGGGR